MVDHSTQLEIPEALRSLSSAVVAVSAADPRILGVLVGGSIASGMADSYSDLDLVLVCSDSEQGAVLDESRQFAGRLGPLLATFSGEHVGEPRLLICLYGSPPRHVDLKFVGLADLAARPEDGVVLWQRDTRVAEALRETVAAWPHNDGQWIEDRFWAWVHYVTAKIARGELFEAVDGLTAMRSLALAPLATAGRTDKPAGVRRLEQLAPEHLEAFSATVPVATRADCIRALWATIDLYRRLRDQADEMAAGRQVLRRSAAEAAVVAALAEI